MTERKPISKRTRFEIFKRDSFTCQYCGAKAPEAVLYVDHIKPVAEGGDGHILNLITACSSCNGGKGKIELSDNSAIEKQRHQMEELEQRRQQLEMLLEWRNELNELQDTATDAVSARLNERTGYRLNDAGKQNCRKWVKQFGLAEIMESVEIAFDQYSEFENGKITVESWGKAWLFVPKIAKVRLAERDKPYLKDLFYIRGILRGRLSYIDERQCLTLLEDAYLGGATIESMKAVARYARNWTMFQTETERFITQQANKKKGAP